MGADTAGRGVQLGQEDDDDDRWQPYRHHHFVPLLGCGPQHGPQQFWTKAEQIFVARSRILYVYRFIF